MLDSKPENQLIELKLKPSLINEYRSISQQILAWNKRNLNTN